jgi:proliferating cell nuclear antigen
MISNDFQKLCRELYSLSETVTFEISNGAVKFQIEGEVGAGSISIKTTEEKVD